MTEYKRLLVLFSLILIWCFATLFAVTDNLLSLKSWFDIYIVICPFIALTGILILMLFEHKNK
jgi:hypothetical protein